MAPDSGDETTGTGERTRRRVGAPDKMSRRTDDIDIKSISSPYKYTSIYKPYCIVGVTPAPRELEFT